MIPYCTEPIRTYNQVENNPVHIETTCDFSNNIISVFKSDGNFFLFQLERKNCESLNKIDILRFLKANPRVKTDILDVLDIINNNFGENQKTNLELFINDDENYSNPELFINIIKEEYSDEDMDTFNSVNNWFVNNIYKFRKCLNINIDYK